MAKPQSFIARLQARRGFLLSVYGLLAVQLAVAAAVVYGLRERPDLRAAVMRWIWIWVVAFIAVAIALLVSRFRGWPMWLRLTLFTAFSVLLGLLTRAAAEKVPDALIERALIGTVAAFAAMSVLAVGLAAAGVDLGPWGYALCAALMGLICARLVLLFTSNGPETKGVRRVLYMVGVVLFSLFIAYDTNRLLQVSYDTDVVDGALSFYLDVVNLFQDLLGTMIDQ